MKVEERFIGNAYIYREKEKAQILKNKVTGPSTQEYLRPFYEELESENRGSLQDMEKMQSVDLKCSIIFSTGFCIIARRETLL